MNHEHQEEKSMDRYLGYLDKEMSIMGILSTFCVAVPALIVERLASANAGELLAIWQAGERFFWTGSVLFLVGVALFYKQRSLIAFYYGRIALADSTDGVGLAKWKECADSWTAWLPYHFAFWLGVAATVEYVIGFASQAHPTLRSTMWSSVMPVVIAVMICVAFAFVAKDRPIRFRDNPWLWRLFDKAK
jgi:hypothetical protein